VPFLVLLPLIEGNGGMDSATPTTLLQSLGPTALNSAAGLVMLLLGGRFVLRRIYEVCALVVLRGRWGWSGVDAPQLQYCVVLLLVGWLQSLDPNANIVNSPPPSSSPTPDGRPVAQQ